MTSRATLAYMVYWDPEFNRPIVDGKIAHPVTGEIQDAGPIVVDGPSGVQIHLFNMNSDQNIRSVSVVKPVPMERVYLAVAKHLKRWDIQTCYHKCEQVLFYHYFSALSLR